MRNKLIFSVEIACVFTMIILFLLKHIGLGLYGWLIVFIPLFIMGAIRTFVVFLVGIYSISSLYRLIKWKITGKITAKKKSAKKKRKKGTGMRV